jgi:hypothetical protein
MTRLRRYLRPPRQSWALNRRGKEAVSGLVAWVINDVAGNGETEA